MKISWFFVIVIMIIGLASFLYIAGLKSYEREMLNVISDNIETFNTVFE